MFEFGVKLYRSCHICDKGVLPPCLHTFCKGVSNVITHTINNSPLFTYKNRLMKGTMAHLSPVLFEQGSSEAPWGTTRQTSLKKQKHVNGKKSETRDICKASFIRYVGS